MGKKISRNALKPETSVRVLFCPVLPDIQRMYLKVPILCPLVLPIWEVLCRRG